MREPVATLRVFPDMLARSVSRGDAGGANRRWRARLTVRHATLGFATRKVPDCIALPRLLYPSYLR
jgi:hypothetical protein